MKSEKLKNILSNQYFILGTITILALFIRLLNLDKPFGLWYDEMLTYIFSSKSLPFGIIKALLREDFHMPLYYFYVHIWMKLFGSSDLILRCSSVIWGVLTIPALYILGKTYRSKSVGYVLCSIGCLSPIMIFYSQELRFYSMLIFLATCSIIFFLRLIESQNRKNFFWFYFINLVILYIYTMGAIFTFAQVSLLFINFYLFKKDYLKPLIKYTVVFSACSIPYLILLFSYINASNQAIIDPLPPSMSSHYTLLSILNDLLSPFITGRYIQDTSAYTKYLTSHAGRLILFFLSSSTVCLCIGFISDFRNINKKLLSLTAIAMSFFLVEIYLHITGNFNPTTRYSVIMLPIILLICTDGLLLIETKTLKNICIYVIFVIFLYNSLNYKNMPAFCTRPNGYNIPAIELAKLNLNKNDFVIFPGRSELLEKYVKNSSFIKLDIPGLLYLDKSKKEALKVFDKQFVDSTNRKNSLDKLIPYFLSTEPSANLKQFINSDIEKIARGNRLILVDDWNSSLDVNLIPPFINQYKNNKDKKNIQLYKKMIFNFAYAKIYDDLTTILNNNTTLKKVETISVTSPGEKSKKWSISIYEKL